MISNTDPTPSEATEPPPITLEDLYRAIDWSGSDQALQQFYAQSNRSDERENEGFRKKFRCVLLQEALYGENTVRTAARYFLHLAGVLDQVVSFCKTKGLVK